MKSSSSIAQEPNFVELKSNQIGFCKDDEFSIDQSKLNKVLNQICLKDKGMGSLETFSYKERLHGDFSFYDNCVDEVSINGQTEQTGKISYLVDFSCRMLADNNTSDKVEVASNNESSLDTTKIVQETDEELKNEEESSFNKSGLPSHCSELYGCAPEKYDQEIEAENRFAEQVEKCRKNNKWRRFKTPCGNDEYKSRVNSYKNSTYSDSRLNSSSSGKFANLNPQQRAHCQDKLNRGKIKLDRSSNLYYEMENLPLQGLQKKYVCNNDGSQGLALFNAFVGGAAAIANNQNPSQNYNPSPVPNQPFSLGSPTMKQAIFKLTQAQGYFLEALDEEEHAIAVRQYSMNLNRGTAIGEDDMEKILEKSHEWQTIINKKMKEGFVLDAKAKQTFSQGIPHYASGTALCIAGGFSVASQVSAVTNSSGAAAVIGGIGLAFSAYDSVKALNLFFSSTSDIYAFGKENNVDNIEELEKAKDSLGT